jgi:regulator of replication initiation timing
VDELTLLRIDHTVCAEFWLEIDLSKLICNQEAQAQKLQEVTSSLGMAHKEIRDLSSELESIKELNDNLEMKNLVLRDKFTPICIACGRPCVIKEHMGQCRDCFQAMQMLIHDLSDDGYATPTPLPAIKASSTPPSLKKRGRTHDVDDLLMYVAKLETDNAENARLLKKYRAKYSKCMVDLESANIRLRDQDIAAVIGSTLYSESEKMVRISEICKKYEPDYADSDNETL